MIERNEFEMYWHYYLSIEKMMRNTSQYVYPVQLNKKTYSDEFMKIILLSCSEIDSILKIICKEKEIEVEDRKYNMSVYSKALLQYDKIKEMAYSPECNTSSRGDAIICEPFRTLDEKKPYAALEWWGCYQKLKHGRLENVALGNLENAVYVISAHYILIRLLMDMLPKHSGKEYVINNYWSKYLIPCI